MHRRAAAFSLLEVLAVISILGVLAYIGWARATSGGAQARSAGCKTIRAEIEVQVELWRQNTGAWPTASLSNIGADLNYFPAGLPVCPVNGSAYTINSTGRVVGHNH